MATPQLHIGSSDEVPKAVCDFVAAVAKRSASERGFFSVGLSGGSVAKFVSQGLRDRGDVDWSTWRVFYCDERLVPFTSEDSTHAFIKQELLDRVPISPEHVFAVDPAIVDDPEAAAEDYARKIRSVFPGDELPAFDLLLLGMGPDGHTCSLFPGHPGLAAGRARPVIPITDSPKPPPRRITLTLPVLNEARCVAVVATGEGKKEAVRGCLEPDEGAEPLPAGLVRPRAGELHWFMDAGAAMSLSKK